MASIDLEGEYVVASIASVFFLTLSGIGLYWHDYVLFTGSIEIVYLIAIRLAILKAAVFIVRGRKGEDYEVQN